MNQLFQIVLASPRAMVLKLATGREKATPEQIKAEAGTIANLLGLETVEVRLPNSEILFDYSHVPNANS